MAGLARTADSRTAAPVPPRRAERRGFWIGFASAFAMVGASVLGLAVAIVVSGLLLGSARDTASVRGTAALGFLGGQTTAIALQGLAAWDGSLFGLAMLLAAFSALVYWAGIILVGAVVWRVVEHLPAAPVAPAHRAQAPSVLRIADLEIRILGYRFADAIDVDDRNRLDVSVRAAADDGRHAKAEGPFLSAVDLGRFGRAIEDALAGDHPTAELDAVEPNLQLRFERGEDPERHVASGSLQTEELARLEFRFDVDRAAIVAFAEQLEDARRAFPRR